MRSSINGCMNIARGKRAAELKRKQEKLSKLNLDETFWNRLATYPKSQVAYIKHYLTNPVTWAELEQIYNLERTLMQNHYRRIMRELCI